MLLFIQIVEVIAIPLLLLTVNKARTKETRSFTTTTGAHPLLSCSTFLILVAPLHMLSYLRSILPFMNLSLRLRSSRYKLVCKMKGHHDAVTVLAISEHGVLASGGKYIYS